MSPEQIQGRDVDQRSDLFAFGIMLYEMLTGRHPWPRPSPVDTLHAILHDDPPAIHAASLMHAELAAIVQKLLRKSPAERYQVADAVLEALGSRAASRGSSASSVAGPTPLTSIAVLPFIFLSGVEEGKGLSLGFADALITMLGRLDDITVLPTSAILNYAAGTDPARACRDLGTRHLLQGNVQKLGAHWRVSMHLFDAMTQKSISSEQHDFDLENVFDVQDEIGRQVVESLRKRFPPAVPKSRDRYSSDPEAYNEFMAGLRESYSDRPDTLESAIQHLSKAVERDPELALAHAWLSFVSTNVHFEFDPRRTLLEKAEHHCRRALHAGPGVAGGTFGAGVDPVEPGEEFPARWRPSRRWNRCWPCNPISSGPTTGWRRFVPISDAFMNRASPTSVRSGRIQRLGPATSSSTISIAATSRARKRQARPSFEKDPDPAMRSISTPNLRS